MAVKPSFLYCKYAVLVIRFKLTAAFLGNYIQGTILVSAKEIVGLCSV
jgi:hypothetical protein